LTMPLDIVLGIALPLHAHIGMNYGELLTLPLLPSPPRALSCVSYIADVVELLRVELFRPKVQTVLFNPPRLQDKRSAFFFLTR